MSSFRINGGRPLSGEISAQGAKNEALQVLCAVLLTSEECIIDNIPNIRDVNRLIELLSLLGVKVKKLSEGSYTFKADQVNIEKTKTKEYATLAGGLRGSIMLVGPMLARFHKAINPIPGGDKIGRRRLDTHYEGFCALGASVAFDDKLSAYSISAEHLKGTYMLLEEASVTGTANIVMSAVMAQGVTTIFNAACEPYLYQLCTMLNQMGAKISGVGSNLLTIEGVASLHGTTHRLLPDMIEVGSFIGLAAMTQSDITIKDVNLQQLGLIPKVFSRLGIKMDLSNDNIHIPAQEIYEVERFMDGSIMTIADAPWPGFTPDLISIALVVATQAKGSVLIHQKMFESRLFFVDKLIDMGAQIILCDPHRATIIGLGDKFRLRAANMSSPDIRAGIALLIAALGAEGASTINNIEQIDRGYEHIDKRLNALGANITRK